MRYISLNIPYELDSTRKFWAVIENGSKKTVMIELDEDDKNIIDFSCSCKANTIKVGENKSQIMCKHLKDFKEKIKSLGYLNEN